MPFNPFGLPKAPANALQQAPLPPALQQLLKMGGYWESGLLDCLPCSSCVLATFVPCFVLGRTSSRLLNPTSLQPGMFNVDCLVHGLLACGGLGWIWVMLKRAEIRTRFAIPGDELKDCCIAYWCTCCAIIQHDNEVIRRMPNPEKLISEQPQLAEAMAMAQAARP